MIAAKEVATNLLYEDEQIIAFADLNPVAPTHVLIVPKKHITSLQSLTPDDEVLLGHVLITIPLIATKLGLADDGYRVVINTGKNGGQTVPHVHWHLLGGRSFEWPPG